MKFDFRFPSSRSGSSGNTLRKSLSVRSCSRTRYALPKTRQAVSAQQSGGHQSRGRQTSAGQPRPRDHLRTKLSFVKPASTLHELLRFGNRTRLSGPIFQIRARSHKFRTRCFWISDFTHPYRSYGFHRHCRNFRLRELRCFFRFMRCHRFLN